MSIPAVILVTSFGWLGQFVVDELLREFPDSTIYIGYHSEAPILDAGTRVQSLHLDLADDTNVDEVIERSRPTVVIHLAAITSPVQCQKNPELCKRINQPSNLIESLKKYNLYNDVRFIFASTDHVYDGLRPTYNIGDVTQPINNYGKSKIDYEAYLLENNTNNQIVILRLANMLGPMYKYKMKSGKFLQFLVEKCLNNEYILVKNEVRSFLYIHDSVRIIVEAARAKVTTGPVYNVGGPDSLSRLDLCRLVAGAMGKKLVVVDEVAYNEIKDSSEDGSTWYVGMQAVDPLAPLDSPINVSMNSEATFSSFNVKCHKIEEIISATTEVILQQLAK